MQLRSSNAPWVVFSCHCRKKHTYNVHCTTTETGTCTYNDDIFAKTWFTGVENNNEYPNEPATASGIVE